MNFLIIICIITALIFNFVNGLNDAGNSIATVIATRSLPPFRAITIATVCNLLGPFIFTLAIAKTLSSGIIDPEFLTPIVIVVAIMTASILVIIATVSGLPVSSTHALVGGLVGAGIASYGLGALLFIDSGSLSFLIFAILFGSLIGIVLLSTIGTFLKLTLKFAFLSGALFGISFSVPLLILAGLLHVSGLVAIIVFIFISPLLGFFGAFMFDVIISYLFRYSRQNFRRRIFKPLQVFAAAFQAISHGAHDGQHAVAIITALLLSEGFFTSFIVPFWVLVVSALAISAGTFFGGWKVIEKMAKKITKIRPYQGFSASTSAGIIISLMTSVGIPISSTHVMSGAIVGVGITRGRGAIQWDAVRTIIAAWLITIPLGIAVSWIFYRAIDFFIL